MFLIFYEKIVSTSQLRCEIEGEGRMRIDDGEGA